ncbi:MAG: TetR/AcrR family transcriptional regulator, partial [Ferruginibacter sp.]|nr:TetR/AcrR family transcriptional regulator [Ferruginibacter sp.]
MQTLVADRARDLFFSYGLKSISMDDIAKKAGISKKTIYKDFEDKTALVQQLVTDLLTCHGQAVEKCAREANDAVEEVIRYTSTPFHTIAVVNQTFFYELEKFFPAVWKEVTKHRQQILIPSI